MLIKKQLPCSCRLEDDYNYTPTFHLIDGDTENVTNFLSLSAVSLKSILDEFVVSLNSGWAQITTLGSSSVDIQIEVSEILDSMDDTR